MCADQQLEHAHRFVELARLIDPSMSKNDKTSIVVDAIRAITQLRAENNQLRQLNKFLQEKVTDFEQQRAQSMLHAGPQYFVPGYAGEHPCSVANICQHTVPHLQWHMVCSPWRCPWRCMHKQTTSGLLHKRQPLPCLLHQPRGCPRPHLIARKIINSGRLRHRLGDTCPHSCCNHSTRV